MPDEFPDLHSLRTPLHKPACTLLTTCEASVLKPLSPPQACRPVTRQSLDHHRDSGTAAALRDRDIEHWSAPYGLVVCALICFPIMGKNKGGGSAKGQAGGETKGPKPATHVNVRHILCEKHSKVQHVMVREAQSMRKTRSVSILSVQSLKPTCEMPLTMHTDHGGAWQDTGRRAVLTGAGNA